MTDNPKNPDQKIPPEPQEGMFEKALEAMAEFLQPASAPIDQLNPKDYVFYLLLLWSSFEVHQKEPPVTGDDAEGSTGGALVIPASEKRDIHDYGFYLSTSTGEDYRSYCTGPLLETVELMIEMMNLRG